MLRVAATPLAVLAAVLCGCGGESLAEEGGGSCGGEVRFDGRTYWGLEQPWPGLRRDRSRTVRATATCPDDREFTGYGIAGVPRTIAFTVDDPEFSIYLAEGSFLVQRAHPLHAAFFATERPPDHRRGQRCHRRRARTGVIVDLNLFGLAISLDAPRASTVRIDARTRFRGLGKPLARAREGQRVTAKLVKCPDSNKPVATLIRRAG